MHRIFNYWCQKISQSFNFRHFTLFISCVYFVPSSSVHHLLINPVVPFFDNDDNNDTRLNFSRSSHSTRYKWKFNAIILMWSNCTNYWDKFCLCLHMRRRRRGMMKTLPSIHRSPYSFNRLMIQSFIIMTNCLWRHFRDYFWRKCTATCLEK